MTKPRIPTAAQKAEADRLLRERGAWAEEERADYERRRREQRESEAATAPEPQE